MAYNHSYGATLKNNITETSAIDFLLVNEKRLRKPTAEERGDILKRFNLPVSFSRAFDLVLLPSENGENLKNISIENIILVELKTTQKKLVNNPEGFFFGATENEFNLADKLGKQYLFCFVSLHSESRNYVMMTSEELMSKIKRKRLQYQINL